jgi:hypothetical protein
VAKTPVDEIHLFDGDQFLQHNAFRAPGAPALEALEGGPNKATYFAKLYDRMHKGINAHPYFLDESNIHELDSMDFVFICMDKGESKRTVVERLRARGTPFIDVGMGVYLVDNALGGIIRVTTGTAEKSDHLDSPVILPVSDGGINNEYNRNIQVADLNALNAALAVMRWKKLRGFYHDLGHEHFASFTIERATLINEERS